MKKTRINKFLAEKGIASRRAIDAMIEEGRITVNGYKASPGMQITPNDNVTIDDIPLTAHNEKKVYILLNKPKGYVTTLSDEQGRSTVRDLINIKERIYPIGRLDKDTTGLLLLTNDGDFAHHLMHPKYEIDKRYEAHLKRPLQKKEQLQLEKGVTLDRKMTAPAQVHILNKEKTKIQIIIHEGKKRQIRRMLESVDNEVLDLKRTYYYTLHLGDLKEGEWRHLTAEEMKEIKAWYNKGGKKVHERKSK